MSEYQRCTKCGGRPALHEVFWPATGVVEHLCCQCNALDETADYADWHEGCEAAWRRADRARQRTKT